MCIEASFFTNVGVEGKIETREGQFTHVRVSSCPGS